MSRAELVTAVRQAIEEQLELIMEFDVDFDGFGVDTLETNRLAEAAVDVMVTILSPPF